MYGIIEERSYYEQYFYEDYSGELPCYKIYEDERTFAFLDIEPEAPGAYAGDSESGGG